MQEPFKIVVTLHGNIKPDLMTNMTYLKLEIERCLTATNFCSDIVHGRNYASQDDRIEALREMQDFQSHLQKMMGILESTMIRLEEQES